VKKENNVIIGEMSIALGHFFAKEYFDAGVQPIDLSIYLDYRRLRNGGASDEIDDKQSDNYLPH
jgi:hypothetical protein